MISSHKELTVWQRAMELVIEIYKLTEQFPREEIYGLTTQMRRAAVSVPSNIAEGRSRGSRRDFAHFLVMAYGSGAELETQLEIVKMLPKTKNLEYSKASLLLTEVMKMLNTIIKKLKLEASS